MTVADPNGAARLTAANEHSLVRYHFGHRIADYILCAACGAYAGAVQDDNGQPLATISVAGLAVPAFADREAEPVQYDDEAPDARRKRRRAAWMPLNLNFTDTA